MGSRDRFISELRPACLQREFKDSQGYTDRNPVLKSHEKKKKKENRKRKKRKIEIHKEEIKQDFCILFGI